MSGRQLIVLGTASQAPTRYRNHNGYALRWDDQLIFFDPGEGTQRQCTLAGVAVARATAVCVTHFHGDHCLGLPGIIQRRALDNRSSTSGLGPLPIYFPADGLPYFERLRTASIFHDTSDVVPKPLSFDEAGDGVVATLGKATRTLSIQPLDHRTTTYGFRIDEADGVHLNRDALAARGIVGPDVGRLLADGRFETTAGTVGLAQVSEPRRGQSMAFIMDTGLCEGAERLADGVDLLVCESTFLHRDVELAVKYRHLTALQAATLARDAGARRLVLSHFSARYPDNAVFADEAAAVHDDVVVAQDLLTVDVPKRR